MNRNGFFFLLFAIVIAITFTWLNSTWLSYKGFALDQQEKQIDYYLSDFSILHTYPDGTIRYLLKGDHLVHQQANKSSKIIKPRITAKDIDSSLVKIKAEEAIQEKNNGPILLKGSVYVKKESDQLDEEFQLLSSDLSYNPISHVLSTDAKLTFINASGEVNGIGFSTKLDEQELRIHKNVQAKFIPIN